MYMQPSLYSAPWQTQYRKQLPQCVGTTHRYGPSEAVLTVAGKWLGSTFNCICGLFDPLKSSGCYMYHQV